LRTPLLTGVLALASAAALAGCIYLDLSGPGPDRRVDENHGRFIADAFGFFGTLSWSPAGDALAFISTDLRSALAYHPPSGTTREVYAATTPGEQIFQVAFSTDGLESFTTSSGSAGRVIRRHTSEGWTVLTENGSWSQSAAVVVASGEPLAAFVEIPDRLHVVRRGGEPTLVGEGCAAVVAFSPDGSRVLCAAPLGAPATPGFQVFDIDTGAAEPLDIPPQIAAAARSVRWRTDGMQTLFWGNLRFEVYDHSTRSVRPLSPAAAYPETTDSWSASWSGDGRKAAYGNWYCAQAEGIFSCRHSQVFLYALDVATAASTRLAVHTLRDGGLQVALSPDGSLLAYTVNGGLYMLEVP
jgi:WD40 repeat protein